VTDSRGSFLERNLQQEQSPGERAWYRQSCRRKQIIAMIITDQSEEVSQHILKEMRRGVTAWDGKGMYTGKSHGILMCALTITEVNQLKALVQAADSHAFVIVMPAQEILGRGFLPFNQG
jgi:uncharacterized membrane-anchored protein YitT (DUF2179 family)